MAQSAQDFAKENLTRIKRREEQVLKAHAAIKRKEFEERQQKQKEQEIKEKEVQMKKLQEERELIKKEHERHEKYLKELHE